MVNKLHSLAERINVEKSLKATFGLGVAAVGGYMEVKGLISIQKDNVNAGTIAEYSSGVALTGIGLRVAANQSQFTREIVDDLSRIPFIDKR